MSEWDQFPDAPGAPVDEWDAFPDAQQPQSSPIRDTAMGALELGTAAGTGLVADVAGGLGGVVQTLNPFAAPGAGAQAVESIRDTMTYQPGERGQQMASSFADRIRAIADALPQSVRNPIAQTMQSIQQSPDAVAERYGPLAGSIAATLPAAIGSVAGLPVARQAGAAGARAMEPVADTLEDVANRQDAGTRAIGAKLASGSTDRDTAKYRIEKPARPGKAPDAQLGGVKVGIDKRAAEAVRQGFDEGVIAAVKAASPVDKQKMQRMVDLMEMTKKNARAGMTNRPSDVAGDSLMERVRVIQKTNRDAGSKLDGVAKSLKGQRVDFDPAVKSFLDDLSDMGITLGDDLKPNFSGSDLEGALGAQRVINQIVHRMSHTKAPDAYDVHRLKRFIDEQVTYGKNAEGLAGNAERILKKLRRNMDQTLDAAFPEYNDVNTTYAETIGALDALQDVAGKKMDMTGPNADKATGTLMRRLMSNAQSRVPLLDAIDDIESVAKKYGEGALDDDLLNQALFVDELDKKFGPVARTSFQGQIEQPLTRAVQAASSKEGMMNAIIGGVGKLDPQKRGINEDAAFRSIRELLSEGTTTAK